MKPLQQLFGLALEDIWTYQGKKSAIKTYTREMTILDNETPDMEEFMKKKEKYCSVKIKTLLFDAYLRKTTNDKEGNQSILKFLKK